MSSVDRCESTARRQHDYSPLKEAAKEHGIRSGRIALAPEPREPTTASTTSPQTAPAGRSSSRATSEPVPEPDHSSPGEVTGRDRPPFAPDKAPVRIPEAPRPVVIRG